MTTNTNKQIWLLIEKIDDTRVSKGPEGYNDDTGKLYNYDSNVRNHKNLKVSDIVILRKEKNIHGFGVIADIISKPDTKIIKRCHECDTTDIVKRKTIYPPWKCRKCKTVFETPNETVKDIIDYNAEITDYRLFNKALAVNEVKSWAIKGNGIKFQNSIIELDFEKIKTLKDSDLKSFEKINLAYSQQETRLTFQEKIEQSERNISKKKLTKAEKEIVIKFRIGQSFFRKELIEFWDGCCSISGFDKTELLIASHIKPYSKCKKHEKYDVHNGLLLTPNFDKLFDKFLISFDKNGKILISTQLITTDIKKLRINEKSVITLKEEHKRYMKYHRKMFFEKQNSPK